MFATIGTYLIVKSTMASIPQSVNTQNMMRPPTTPSTANEDQPEGVANFVSSS